MIWIILTFLFILLASICNATMDKVDHHYFKSVFRHFKNKLWWNGDEGWRNKYVDRDPNKGRVKWLWGLINKPVQLTDSWHFFKMLMIIFNCSAIVCALRHDTSAPVYAWYGCITLLILYGTVWNLTFTLFYHRIFDNPEK